MSIFRNDFFDLLIQMLRNGMPLTTSLEVCGQELHGQALGVFINDVHTFINEGGTFHEKFEKYPDLFPPPIPAFIRAGETAGDLEQALELVLEGMRTERLPDQRERSIMGGLKRFMFSMGALLKLGMPLLEILDTLVACEPNEKFKDTLLDIQKTLNDGGPIADALNLNRYVFSPAVIEMVRQSEMNGRLDETFLRISAGIQRNLFHPPN